MIPYVCFEIQLHNIVSDPEEFKESIRSYIKNVLYDVEFDSDLVIDLVESAGNNG